MANIDPNTGLESGVSVNTDFEIPQVDPALVGLSEEELKKAIEAKVDAAPPAPEPEPLVAAPQEPIAPEPTPKAQKPVEQSAKVPEKFQKPDGTLDEEKLQKSKATLDEYLAAEKELTRLRQESLAQPLSADQTNAHEAFLARVRKDFEEDPAMAMEKMSNAIGGTIAAGVSGRMDNLESQLALSRMTGNNAEMLTKEMLASLTQIRKERPHLTWQDALEIQKGRQGNTGPTAAQSTPRAPIVPGGIAPSVPTTTSSEALTEEKVNELLKGKSSIEQEKILEKLLPHQ